MTVRIVTDSIADLLPKVVAELAITVFPLNVCFGTEVYRDGIDLIAGNCARGQKLASPGLYYNS